MQAKQPLPRLFFDEPLADSMLKALETVTQDAELRARREAWRVITAVEKECHSCRRTEDMPRPYRQFTQR